MKSNEKEVAVVINTPIVDDKGHVVGTEPRKFVLALQGRNLEVEEFGGPPPTQQDKQDVAKFVHLAKSSPLEAASLLAFKSEADFSRFRKQWKLEGKPQLIEFIKANFSVGFANIVSALLYNKAEYCADEIHLATMGLADNHNAVVDVICSADDALLQQISVFYGIKFGDGKYEIKSADGKGDQSKLLKDVKFALRGHVADLVLRRLEHAHASGNDNNAATLGVEWSDAVCNQLASWKGSVEHATDLSNKIGGGDSALARAVFARISDPDSFWALRLREAVQGSLNKKLVLRVIALVPTERRAIVAKKVPELKERLSKDPDAKFLMSLFRLE